MNHDDISYVVQSLTQDAWVDIISFYNPTVAGYEVTTMRNAQPAGKYRIVKRTVSERNEVIDA